MAINVICKSCKSNSALQSKQCKKCGASLRSGCRYKIIVKNAKGKRMTKTVATITEAKKFEAKFKTDVEHERYFGVVPAPVIDSVWKKYVTWAKLNKKSWKDDEERWKRHIKEHVTGQKMDEIRAFDIQQIPLTMLSKRPYAPATIKQVLVLVKRIFNWAIQMDLYEGRNPVNRIKMPKLNNERTECLSKEQCRKLVVFLGEWENRAAATTILFAYYTGLRAGEVFNLQWGNVDLERGLLRLVDTKGGKDSSLPFNDGAKAALIESFELFGPERSEYCFPSPYEGRRVEIRGAWKVVKEAVGIDPTFRFHGLRHNFASHLASSGKVSMFALQRLLTHKSPQMTQRYAHLLDDSLRDGISVMESILD